MTPEQKIAELLANFWDYLSTEKSPHLNKFSDTVKEIKTLLEFCECWVYEIDGVLSAEFDTLQDARESASEEVENEDLEVTFTKYCGDGDEKVVLEEFIETLEADNSPSDFDQHNTLNKTMTGCW